MRDIIVQNQIVSVEIELMNSGRAIMTAQSDMNTETAEFDSVYDAYKHAGELLVLWGEDFLDVSRRKKT